MKIRARNDEAFLVVCFRIMLKSFWISLYQCIVGPRNRSASQFWSLICCYLFEPIDLNFCMEAPTQSYAYRTT